MNQNKNIRNRVLYMFVWLVISMVLFLRYYEHIVIRINTTMMAFSYKYGFVSRGLIGSVYQLLDKMVPKDLMNYLSVYHFTEVMTLLFFLILAVFVWVVLIHTDNFYLRTVEILILFFTIFAIPMFVSQYNFGRLDLYLVMISLIAAVLWITKRAEWMIVPLSAVGIMIHQGYAFMFYNIILVLLVYRILSTQGKEKKKYLAILLCSLISCILLFFWFEVFSHINGSANYKQIVSDAKAIGFRGKFHKDVVDKEILGVDLSAREVAWHLMNLVQFPIFLILFMPYIVMVWKFFRGCLQSVTDKKDKLNYFLLAAGVLAILPDMLFKVDFGRWVFCMICYYCVVVLALITTKDQIILTQLQASKERITARPWAIFLLIYPVFFQPLMDVSICQMTAMLAGILNNNFLHFW